MRFAWALVAGLVAGTAGAQCPPDCLGGGGPVATDCFVAFGGLAATSATCTDGDAACDADGVADGTCTVAVQACANVGTLAGCTAGTLDGPPTVKGKDGNAAALAAALGALDPAAQGCTPATLTVPLKVSLAGLKPGVSKLKVTAASGGKKDKDKLRLTCAPDPTPRSLATDVQPIFGQRVDGVLQGRCSYSACHDPSFRAGGQSLAPEDALASSVNVPSVNVPKLVRVSPGSIKKSYMARKVLGLGIGATSIMPQGCPSFPPAGGCLTDAEKLTILYWIANGAQP
jgi:hypothetical protein